MRSEEDPFHVAIDLVSMSQKLCSHTFNSFLVMYAEEENPMIGLRGASRYLHPDFRESFELECRALSHVRNQMCLDNVHLMVPFCRTPEEGKGVIQTLADQGLVQGENGLKIWVMCEIPSNVLAVDEFARGI